MSRIAIRPCLTLLIPVLLLVYCGAQQEAASPWQTQAGEFVQSILARAGTPSAITVNFDNASAISSADYDALKKILLTDFRNSGVRLVKAELSQAQVQITFSEDWQSYVWVANIRQASGNQVVIKKVARPQKSSSTRTPTLTLRRNLVWQQEAPILDLFNDGKSLIILESEQIAAYANDNGQWRPRQTLAISHERSSPRDLRGRLQVNGSQITAFLPGTLCSGSISPPALQCRTSDDPWQVDQNLAAFFSPARNFFTGVLAGHSAGETVPAFFSGAAIEKGDLRQWVFAGTDGRARLYISNLATPVSTVSDWGSNIAAVQSSCGTGWQVLITFPNDLTHADAVQAMEFQNHEAVSVSSSTELSGPVLAFWPGETPQTANAVVQSLATNKYEAWNFTVACNP